MIIQWLPLYRKYILIMAFKIKFWNFFQTEFATSTAFSAALQ